MVNPIKKVQSVRISYRSGTNHSNKPSCICWHLDSDLERKLFFLERMRKNCCYTNQSRVEDGEVAQPRENKTLQDLGAHSFGIHKADIGSLKGRLEVAKV